jgi:hypothetical protein
MRGHFNNLKSARLKERRRKIVVGKIFITVFCVAGLWSLTFWLSGLPSVTISGVEVSGTVSESASVVASTTESFLVGRYFYTVPRANILLYPRASIEKEILKSFPRVKKVGIRLRNLHTLAVEIVEREPAGLWCEPSDVPIVLLDEKWDDCYFLDDSGYIFHRLDLSSATSTDSANIMLSSRYPVYLKFYSLVPFEKPVGESYETPERFRSFLEFAKNINSLGLNILAFREREDADFDIDLVGGVRLIVSRDAVFSSVFSNLQAIVSDQDSGGVEGFKKADYVDMRFGNKVFYKRR